MFEIKEAFSLLPNLMCTTEERLGWGHVERWKRDMCVGGGGGDPGGGEEQ